MGRPTIETNYIKFGIRGKINNDIVSTCSTAPNLPLNFIKDVAKEYPNILVPTGHYSTAVFSEKMVECALNAIADSNSNLSINMEHSSNLSNFLNPSSEKVIGNYEKVSDFEVKFGRYDTDIELKYNMKGTRI